MATPTNPHVKPTNASLPNATTPQNHLAFSSPAPRSVPSPAAQRNQTGKSPFNASTHAPSTGTTAAHNHPTGGSSASASKALLGSSPAGMFNFDSPNPMTMSLSNMGGLESIGMGISMSGLGMGLSMTGRGNEQERTKRLEEVINLLRTRPGRVSPDGLRLMAQRTGMISELTVKRDGTSICTIAGGSVLVDVSFNAEHRVKNVEVSYPTSPQAVKDSEESASRILADTLSVPPGHSEINLTLDKFAKNLDKLSQLDKLNGPAIEQTFNCFEAISGIYTSLRKLYEHEKKLALDLLKASDELDDIADREVMCRKSGRPVMNDRNELGLKLDYWMQKRHVRNKHRKQVDLDGDHDMNAERSTEQLVSEKNSIYTLSIECEASVPEMYPPARVSDAWISDQIEKPVDDLEHPFGPVIQWLDPPPTYLTKTSESDSTTLGLNTLDKLPSIRFVAKLNPPLLLPLQVAINVLGSVGLQQDHIMTSDHIGTFDALLLHSHASIASTSSNASKREGRIERVVLSLNGQGTESHLRHSNSLFVPKPEFARYVREIPFAHPRQLVQILPILRQYAFLTSILSQSFSPNDQPPALSSIVPASLPVDVKLSGSTQLSLIFPRSQVEDAVDSASKSSIKSGVQNLTLAKLLANGRSKSSGSSTNPNQAKPSSISVTVDILLDGAVAIVDQNLRPYSDPDPDTEMATTESGESIQNANGNETSQRLADALDICGDIGIWVEWMRKNFTR